MKITNTQSGPRGINTVNGPVLLDPKQTVEVDVYEREQSHLDASGWFDIEGDYTPNPGPADAPPMNSDATSAEIAALKSEVASLKADVKAKDAAISALKKAQAGDTGTTVTTAGEALALFTTDGVHVNTAKAGAKKFLGAKVKDDASKDEIIAALLADASDSELKTYLGAKGVQVKDETRDDLIKLALAA